MEVQTTHYKAKCDSNLKDVAYRYILDIEKVWDIMVKIFGKEPVINKYIVDFTMDNKVCYLGNGNIEIYKSELEKLPPYPKDLAQGLTFETFHGFLEHVKHRPDGINGHPYYGENKLGESFSTILKIELLDRLGLSKDADAYKKGRGMGVASHHQLLFLLVEIHNKYGIILFQKLFRLLENHKKPIIIQKLPKNDLCYYFSLCAKQDLSNIFEKHDYPISPETKNRIKDLKEYKK